MNIFFHELKAYRKSTIVWTLSLVALVVLFMSMFPSISREADEFAKMLEGFPEALRKALGLQISSLGSILGFYSYIFIYVSLCGAIQAMNLGISLVSKETREKTADFLLTKPVTRKQILTAKLFAALVSLLLTNVVFQIASYFMAMQVKTADYNTKAFLLISLSLVLIQLIFLSLGALLSIVFPKIKSVLTVSLGTVFAFFIIGMISAAGEDEAKRYLSPFKYFDNAYIIKHETYESPFMIAGVVIIALSIVASYIIYVKRDIHSV